MPIIRPREPSRKKQRSATVPAYVRPNGLLSRYDGDTDGLAWNRFWSAARAERDHYHCLVCGAGDGVDWSQHCWVNQPSPGATNGYGLRTTDRIQCAGNARSIIVLRDGVI